MILIRNGPRFLFLKTGDKKSLCALLEEKYSAAQRPFEQAFDAGGEGDTILFIVEDDKEKGLLNNSTPVLLLNFDSSLLLLDLINEPLLQKTIDRAELGPGMLVMKASPPEEKMVEKVKTEYGALATTLLEAIKIGPCGWTVVSFTAGPLSRPLKNKDFLETSLLIKKAAPEVFQELRRQAIKFITEELEEGVWREIKINIYDSKERYNTHYQRVCTAIEDLEIGLILGETWSVDHPFVLMSVPVYQIQLFTYLNPKEVKKIMMSLEYDAAGTRIADIDLYHRNRRIEWGGVERERKLNRMKMGQSYRENFFSNLTPPAREKLDRLEESLGEKEK